MNNKQLTMNNDKVVKRNGTWGWYVFTLLFVALLFVFGCQNPFEPPKKTFPEGEGYFSLALSNTGAERTIIPQEIMDRVLDDFDLYKLEFFVAGTSTNPTVVERDANTLSEPISLSVGTWDLWASAYLEDETEPAALGILEGIEIAAGETVTGFITLSPVAISGEGEGTFSWSIEYPATLNASNASMTITPLDEINGTPEETVFFSGTTYIATGSIALNMGYYRVVFTRSGFVEWSEILHVYEGMTSHFTFTFVTYTVSFDSNLGSYVQAQTVRKGELATRPANPTRSGYNFIGWSTNSSSNVPYDFNTPVTSSITLYARWVQAIADGIHVRFISFAGDIRNESSLYHLDQYGNGSYNIRSALSNYYTIASQAGTALFYSVHKALADLKSDENTYPANLDMVSIITFTDGLDNGSIGQSIINPIEGQTFGTVNAYADYVSDEIQNRPIANQNITAYSIGVRGNDVEDEDKFISDLAKIASPGESYVFEDFAAVQGMFEDIANGLNFVSSSTVNFTMTTTLLPPDTRVRMTFDVSGTSSANADLSERYLEGTINVTGTGQSTVYTLTDIEYADGISSAAGPGPITGTISGTVVRFVFNNIIGYDPATDVNLTKQWTKTSGASTWQYNSEYSASGSTTITYERRSAIIYLVLDASTSMSNTQINQIRTAVQNFISSLQTKYWTTN
jgi:uncharacterized repeat protein (TIGR02543 family)